MRTRFCGAISLAGSFIFIVPVAAQTIVYGDPLVAPENFAMQIGAKDLQRYPVFTAREDILRDQAASALLPQSNTQTVNHLRLRGGTATQSVIIEDDLPQLSPIGSDNAPLVLQLPRQDLQEMLLLEGPQSARFAANAASGIVQWTSAENSFTATDEQLTSSPYAWSYTQQVASHGTWREGLNFGKKRAAPNKMWWQVYGQREDSRGISQAAGGQERDGWHATFGKVKFGQNLARWRWSLAAQRWTRK
ncbi:MAG: Plug domain-containing protein, partial [Bacteriovoracaceae bacterium]|nr:Plug domain-containing protein [Bacteriovoracaceae bacterium]